MTPANRMAYTYGVLVLAGSVSAGAASRAAPPEAPPQSGPRVCEMRPFDDAMWSFMRARGTPGGALAVVKDGRLVYAQGYGWADREARKQVKPTSRFRIASLSKPVTAAAVMLMIQQGAGGLALDRRVVELLEAASPMDPRLRSITIRHLLTHSAGWDRERSGDPMFQPRQIARDLRTASPPGPDEIVRWMLGRPLDFDPGSRFAYSNFGYCVLGRIMERAAHLPYEAWVRRNLLRPMGIRGMRVGHSLPGGRASDEVKYYQAADVRTSSVFGDLPGASAVPWPYGGFCLESMDSHGGWIASVVDLARFCAAITRTGEGSILTLSSRAAMLARPAGGPGLGADGRPAAYWYALGWQVRPVGTDGRTNIWHNGSLPGTYSLLVCRYDSLCWVVLFNQRSEGAMPPDGEIDPALHKAAALVHDWPSTDLFSRFD